MEFARIWGIESQYALGYLICSLILLALVIGLPWWITRGRLPFWTRGHSVLLTVIVASNGVTGRDLWNQYHIRLTATDVTCGTLLGSRTIRWQDVRVLRRTWPGGRGLHGYRFSIADSIASITIYESTYAHPRELRAFIQEHAPNIPIAEPR